ncbi:hypothetical protein SARC_07897 [Sphaeroforma arctica JP610]|uniref:Scaffold protein Nfu/NifU N-terminal domain-containing protein n=1 Tax=Sphaeroforma arctica JP610 TaxID=667725 RepID=A0A0L0FSE6_9EUKA|nr:hypothetical protein SARC_07897 [Sphaeroforma arctica JP610]KNC79722.1 hypothetical protein SARC_07897 [Sphaeroforma arctica JP610]|eukprot:XP_014153624.1 hypothetical protein SARC_07897 [Sphaeroforma arctica JP610]
MSRSLLASWCIRGGASRAHLMVQRSARAALGAPRMLSSMSRASLRPGVSALRVNPYAVTAMQKRTLFIQTQDTPNPDSLKFYPGQNIMESGQTYFFNERKDSVNSPLAMSLFMVEGVKNVMFADEFLTVSKAPEYSWNEVKPEVFAAIMDFCASGVPVFKDGVDISGSAAEDDDEIVIMIKELLDTRIRPVIQEDGGDISFGHMENGIVYLKLHGACGSCASSTATLKGGVENMLMHYIPEVEGVEQIFEEHEIQSTEAFEKLERELLQKQLSR